MECEAVAPVSRACNDRDMKRWATLALVLTAGSAGCSGVASPQESGGATSSSIERVAEKIDCGRTKRSAKRALRYFVSEQLRTDEASRILPLLAKPKRFFAMTVSSSAETVVQTRKRRDAAMQLAEYGGLRLRIDRFMNADKPSRTTDFGFFATWKGNRSATGKAALDCKSGTAIVLGVAIDDK